MIVSGGLGVRSGFLLVRGFGGNPNPSTVDSHDGDAIPKHILDRLLELSKRKQRAPSFTDEIERKERLREQVREAYNALTDRPEVRAELREIINPQEVAATSVALDVEQVLQNNKAIARLLQMYLFWLDEQDVEFLLLMS